MYTESIYNTKNSKRLLWICNKESVSWKTGGEKFRAKIISYLERNGWEIIDHNFPADVAGGFLKRHLISNVQLIRSFFPIIQQGDIVVEDNYWHSRLILFNLIARVWKSIRIVAVSHHPIHRSFNSVWIRKVVKYLERLFLYTVDHVVVVSESTRQEMIGLDVPARKISVVPDGFDRPLQVNNEAHIGSQLRLLCVGTCYYRKGIEYLLRAIKCLKEKKIVLDLVGDLTHDVPYALRMKALAKELGLEESVIFHGWVSENQLWKLYAGADIYVLPSLWEGFGIVLMEAMFFGLPIVATDVGAIPELIKDGENGFLVPPADSNLLAAAIDRLIEDPLLRERLGRNGQTKCKKSLTWEQVGEKFGAVLNRLMVDSLMNKRRQRS